MTAQFTGAASFNITPSSRFGHGHVSVKITEIIDDLVGNFHLGSALTQGEGIAIGN
jgi:hypothetical protein